MKTLTLILLLTTHYLIFSQEYDYKSTFLDAEYQYSEENYKDALSLFLTIYNHDSTNYNVCFRIGMCYKEMYQKYEKALFFLHKATEDISDVYLEGYHKERSAGIDVYFWIGYIYQNMTLYDKAITYYNKYLENVQEWDYASIDITNYKIKNCKRALQLIKKAPNLEIENAGQSINSGFNDINPCITEDGNTLYFTRAIPLERDLNDEFYDPRLFDFQIYRLTKKEGKWTTLRNITQNIKSTGEFLTASVSATGNKLILVRDNIYGTHYKNMQSGDLYYVELKNGSYGNIIKFPKKINTKKNETFASFSEDEKTLYIVSNRKKGLGGFDIYSSKIDEKGKWSTPINLGDSINTKYNEAHPVSSKGTLFFSSQGHEGIGGYDLFTSKFDSVWQSPENIGIPINTPSDDIGLYPFNEGTQAVVPINFEGFLTFGESDIYNIDLLERKPLELSDTIEKPLVTVELPKNDSITEPELIVQKSEIVPEKETLLQADTISLAESQSTNEKEIFQMKQNAYAERDETKKNALLTIKPIYFDYGKYSINKIDKAYLIKIANILKNHPSIYLEITGYTDSISSSAFNYSLSAKRIQAVVQLLADNGVDKIRFITKPMGESAPIASNSIEEGRKFNRRVEINPVNNKKTDIEIITESAILKIPNRLVINNKDIIIYLGLHDNAIDLKKMFVNKNFTVKNDKINNQYLSYIDKISERKDAIEILNNLLEKGYSDARIISNTELSYLQSNTNNKEVENAEYTIQLAATLKLYNPEKNFPKLDNISIYKGKDNYYRYTYRTFNTLSNASKELQAINQLGHVTAFIIATEKFKKMKDVTTQARN